MKVLVALDTFKGSISSIAVNSYLKTYLEAQGHSVNMAPISDGGENFLDCINAYKHVKTKPMHSTYFTGQHIPAYYLMRQDEAYLELDVACGMSVSPRLDVMHQSSYGLGLVIKDAISNGAKSLVIGIGGSASNDGGAGMLQALGCLFYDQDGYVIEQPIGGLLLHDIARIDNHRLKRLIKDVDIKVACDVKNPLLGKYGASYVYAKQKGASPKDIEQLENNMIHFTHIVLQQYGIDVAQTQGAGAAGGVGYAAKAFLNATLISGMTWMCQVSHLDDKMKQSDLVITGEGYFDQQTDFGKAPIVIAQMAKQMQKKVIGIFGGTNQNKHALFDKIYTLSPTYATKKEAMKHPQKVLKRLLDDIKI